MNVQGYCATGDLTGTLPGTLTFDNGTAFNDYFDYFTFGTTLSFDVDLYGPAITSPDGTSTSGSAFAFSIFSDAAGTMPALTTDTTFGIATRIDVNLDGSTNVTNNSSQATVGPVTSVAAPEPSSVLELFVTTLLILGWVLRRRNGLWTV